MDAKDAEARAALLERRREAREEAAALREKVYKLANDAGAVAYGDSAFIYDGSAAGAALGNYAKVVFAAIAAKPGDRKWSLSKLAQTTGFGVFRMRKGVHELEEKGYLRRVSYHGAHKYFEYMEYVLVKEPVFAEIPKDKLTERRPFWELAADAASAAKLWVAKNILRKGVLSEALSEIHKRRRNISEQEKGGGFMAAKIAFINGKGGCGKTTSIYHVAGVLAKSGEKVLVVDLDKQRNATYTLLMNVPEAGRPSKTVYDVLIGDGLFEDATANAQFKSRGNANPKYYGVDCLVSDIRLEDEAALRAIDGERIGAAFERFIYRNEYEWVLLDMPPSNAAVNDIAFRYMAEYAIVPFSSDLFSVSGYGDIINTLDRAREHNPGLNILGVYLSRYMANCQADCYVRGRLAEMPGGVFIDVQIPAAADVREAVMFGRPISYYREASASKRAYERLVAEVRRRVGRVSGGL